MYLENEKSDLEPDGNFVLLVKDIEKWRSHLVVRNKPHIQIIKLPDKGVKVIMWWLVRLLLHLIIIDLHIVVTVNIHIKVIVLNVSWAGIKAKWIWWRGNLRLSIRLRQFWPSIWIIFGSFSLLCHKCFHLSLVVRNDNNIILRIFFILRLALPFGFTLRWLIHLVAHSKVNVLILMTRQLWMQQELLMMLVVYVQSPTPRIHNKVLRIVLFQLGWNVSRQPWHIETLLVVELVGVLQPLIVLRFLQIAFAEII